jgi:hypothetical protein
LRIHRPTSLKPETGQADIPGAEVSFGDQPGESLAMEATMDNVLGGLRSMAGKGASKAAIAAYLGVPAPALAKVAISAILTPTGLVKFFANTALPAGLAAKKYAPAMGEVISGYGKGWEDPKISQIESAMMDLENPAFGEEHELTPKDAAKLQDLVDRARTAARPTSYKIGDWFKDKWDIVKSDLGRQRKELTEEEETALELAGGGRGDGDPWGDFKGFDVIGSGAEYPGAPSPDVFGGTAENDQDWW